MASPIPTAPQPSFVPSGAPFPIPGTPGYRPYSGPDPIGRAIGQTLKQVGSQYNPTTWRGAVTLAATLLGARLGGGELGGAEITPGRVNRPLTPAQQGLLTQIRRSSYDRPGGPLPKSAPYGLVNIHDPGAAALARALGAPAEALESPLQLALLKPNPFFRLEFPITHANYPYVAANPLTALYRASGENPSALGAGSDLALEPWLYGKNPLGSSFTSPLSPESQDLARMIIANALKGRS